MARWQVMVVGGGARRRPSWAILLGAMALLGLSWLQTAPSRVAVVSPTPPPAADDIGAGPVRSCSSFYLPGRARGVVLSIEKFGGVGDGKTSNTEAFRRAMDHLNKFGDRGGSQLNVPKGRWVTGSFNLTSNFTLFLEEGAVILGSQGPKEWPVIEALPTYGRGRERPGGRHISLIHGDGLTDVVVTGTPTSPCPF